MTLPFHTPLTAQDQRAAGLTEPQPFAMADQVRFSELDVLNHVNNAVYMEWFERVRVRYSQIWGVSSYDLSGDGPRIVIHSAQIHYRQEMRIDETYIVTCRCTAFRTASYTLAQQLWSGGTLRATLDCVLVTLTPDGGAKSPLPGRITQRFVEIDGARKDEPKP